MTYLVPAHWRRFPRTRAQINRAHFFADSLTNFWSFGSNGFENLIPGLPALTPVLATIAATVQGRAYQGATAAYAFATTGTVGSAFTFFAFARTASAATYEGLVGAYDDTGATRRELFLEATSGKISVSATARFYTGGANYADGKWHLFMGGDDGSGFPRAYVDGVEVTLADAGGTGAGSAGMYVGHLAVGLGSYPWTGNIALAGTLNRLVSSAEASEFGRNFSDIYAPLQRRIYSAVTASTVKNRRTLSALGTRTGSRQLHGVM